MLTWQKYTHAVDVWSVGCILAEMLLGRVLFPGKDHVHQFTLITEMLGKPPKEVMERVYSKTVCIPPKLRWADTDRNFRRCSLFSLYQKQSADHLSLSLEMQTLKVCLSFLSTPQLLQILTLIATDLLEKMLDIDPEKRITTTEALAHPYVSTYSDPEDEPVFDRQLDWSLLDSELSSEEWKTKM
jgi:p38 MAP kinase